MRVVAILARYASEMHAAANERRELIIFLVHLAIGIKHVRSIHDRHTHVIEEIIAWLEIAGQVAPARVAEPAVILRRFACQPRHGRVFLSGLAELLLPFVMSFERPVTR